MFGKNKFLSITLETTGKSVLFEHTVKPVLKDRLSLSKWFPHSDLSFRPPVYIKITKYGPNDLLLQVSLYMYIHTAKSERAEKWS